MAVINHNACIADFYLRDVHLDDNWTAGWAAIATEENATANTTDFDLRDVHGEGGRGWDRLNCDGVDRDRKEVFCLFSETAIVCELRSYVN